MALLNRSPCNKRIFEALRGNAQKHAEGMVHCEGYKMRETSHANGMVHCEGYKNEGNNSCRGGMDH